MTHHLKGLIFDCLSFTEGLFTPTVTADREAPLLNRYFTTLVWPYLAAR